MACHELELISVRGAQCEPGSVNYLPWLAHTAFWTVRTTKRKLHFERVKYYKVII